MDDAGIGQHGEGPNPERVQTLPELAHALNLLRGTRSYKVLDKAAESRGGLAASTVSNMLNAKSAPTQATVVTFLIACGLDEQARRPWLAAWERAATSHLRRPPGAV